MGCQLGQPGEGPWDWVPGTGYPTAQASVSFIKGRVDPGLHLTLLLVSDGFQALMNAMLWAHPPPGNTHLNT